MLFGDPELKPLADEAMIAVRDPSNFNWTFIALFLGGVKCEASVVINAV